METIRAFIALELTPEVQRQLAHIQNELKKSGADVKWVKPDGIHLTLKFLGNISLQLIEEVKKVIEQLAKSYKPLKLKVGRLGAFPKIDYPRVIWVGINQQDQLLKLARALEELLLPLGFLREKRLFTPHLTLGRVRSAHNRNQLKELLSSIAFPQIVMQAEKLILFKSTLTPEGAIYQPLHQAKLG